MEDEAGVGGTTANEDNEEKAVPDPIADPLAELSVEPRRLDSFSTVRPRLPYPSSLCDSGVLHREYHRKVEMMNRHATYWPT